MTKLSYYVEVQANGRNKILLHIFKCYVSHFQTPAQTSEQAKIDFHSTPQKTNQRTVITNIRTPVQTKNTNQVSKHINGLHDQVN